jgi:DNA-binding beta-propeller fold protein YncE
MPPYITVSSPQFAAWTPDGKLLVTFISEDGSYGLEGKAPDGNTYGSILSVGTATGQFNWPQGIAVSGSIAYIVDSNNGRIQRLELETHGFLEPFGGLGKKSGLFLRPRGICAFDGEIFVADTRNHRIQVFSKGGVVKRVVGELGDSRDQFRLPTDCAVSSEGELFVVDSKHCAIKVFDLAGRFLRRFGGISSSRKEPGLLNMPTGIALDSRGKIVCVADTGNGRIQVFNTGGNFLRYHESPGVVFQSPQGLALSGFGEMAVSDPDAGRVWITKL